MNGSDKDNRFSEIVRETNPYLRAYLAGTGVARDEIDDLAQDVYVELYKTLHRIPPEATPLQWLKGIARNLAANHFRKLSRRQKVYRESIAEILVRHEECQSRSMVDWDVREILNRCLERLSPSSRRLVQLRYSEELSSQTIAEKIESTAEAVRIALFRIRSSLKTCLGAQLDPGQSS